MSDQPKLLRLRDVLAQTGLSRSSLYRLMQAGRFPRPINIAGTRMVAWLASAVSAAISEWVEDQPSQQETDQ